MKRRVVVQSETIRLLKALIREELNQVGDIGLYSPGPVGALGGVAKKKIDVGQTTAEELAEMDLEELKIWLAAAREGTAQRRGVAPR